MMKHQFIYLHGFNSAFDELEEKIIALSTIGTVNGVTYDTFGDYNSVKEFLLRNISYSDDLVIVGTDVGGFWAATIAKILKCPSVLINPCCSPDKVLSKYVNVTIENAKTGKMNSISESKLESFQGNELHGKDDGFLHKPLVLIDSGDEYLSVAKTRSLLDGFPSHTFNGGNHRFAHMEEALPVIEKYVRTCYT